MTEQEQFFLHTLKTKPIELQGTDLDFEEISTQETFEIVGQFSVKRLWIVEINQKKVIVLFIEYFLSSRQCQLPGRLYQASYYTNKECSWPFLNQVQVKSTEIHTYIYVPEAYIMYCTVYGAVDF